MCKKIISLLILAVTLPGVAGAITAQEIQTQLQVLQEQLNQLQGSATVNVPSACIGITFARTLRTGMTGADVKCLQALLNKDAATQVALQGAGSSGNESTLFGLRTKQAVIKFQEKYASQILTPSGLIRGTGIVGPATMVKLNALLAPLVPEVVPQAQTPAPLPSSTVTTQSQTNATITAIAKASPAVASILITKQTPQYQLVRDPFGFPIGYQPTGQTVTQKIGAGTAFLITADGYLLTNKHVVFDEQATYTVTLADDNSQTAAVIYKDAQNDVAILKIVGSGLPFISLGDSSSLQLGQPVIVIGNALGQYSNSVSLGIISGLNRSIQASDNNGFSVMLTDVIQTDAAINPGNSGGPLLDLNGNAIGINVAMVEGSSNISFALPINPVKAILKTVLGM